MRFKADAGVNCVCICGHSFDVDCDGFIEIPAEIFALRDKTHSIPLSAVNDGDNVANLDKKEDTKESVKDAKEDAKPGIEAKKRRR